MLTTGTITKIIHNGQKCYAVVTGIDTETLTVKFTYDGQNIEATLPKSECKKPRLNQKCELATFIRQMVGVPFLKPTDTKPTTALGEGEPEDPEHEGDDED